MAQERHNFSKLSNFTPKQIEATQATDKYRFLLYGGARGGAKSYWLRWFAAHELIRLANSGIRNAVFGLFCEDYTTLTDRQVNKIAAEFPSWLGEIKESKTKLGLAFYLKDEFGGGMIALRNLDEPAKYQSAEFAGIGVDELTKNPIETFDTLRGSLRWPGVDRPKFVAGTNPGGMGNEWVRSLWIDRRYEGQFKRFKALSKEFHFIKSLPTDNPHLSQSYWDDLNTQPDRIRRAWLLGDWNAFEGMFFSEFSEESEVIDPFEIPDDWYLFGSLDPGYGSPCSFGLSARSPEGVIYRIATYYEAQRNPWQNADGVMEFIRSCPFTKKRMPDWIVSGLDAWAKRDKFSLAATEIDFATVFQSRGLYLRKAVVDRVNGWRTLRGLMPDKFKVFRGYNQPLLSEMAGVKADSRNPEDIQGCGNDIKVLDHALDETRYSVMSAFVPMMAPSLQSATRFDMSEAEVETDRASFS